jgi:hypothetical protein
MVRIKRIIKRVSKSIENTLHYKCLIISAVPVKRVVRHDRYGGVKALLRHSNGRLGSRTRQLRRSHSRPNLSLETCSQPLYCNLVRSIRALTFIFSPNIYS